MGIFNKNEENETNEQKGLFTVIKNERPSDELIWKSPIEDFNNNSQVIVMESEEVLFVKDGVVEATLGGGRHTLNTDNYPFINKLQRVVTGGKNPYSCKIYFVDKAHKLELLWGTDSPIQMEDIKYKFRIGVRARGSYSIQIQDAKKFFVKLMGNTNTFTKEELNDSFKTAFQSKIKVAVAKTMRDSKLSVLEMNTELEEIGNQVVKALEEALDEYGIRLVNFYVVDISIPENDPNYKKISEAYANAFARNIEVEVQGDNWEKLTQKELSKEMIQNQKEGSFASMGANIGLGMATAGMFGNLANQMFTNASGNQNNAQPTNNVPAAPVATTQVSETKTIKCPECGQELVEGSKFCMNCGAKLGEIKCKNCGTKLEANAKFCPECGTRREE